MKKVSSRTILLTLVYTLLCLIAFLIGTFWNDDLPDLLKPDVFSYRMLLGITLFLDWLPSILVSVSLIAFSWFFGHSDLKNHTRFSSAQMKNYKAVLLLASICVLFIFIGTEVFIPLTENAKNQRENRSADYNWCIEQAQESFQANNIYDALFYIETALILYPTSEEVAILKEEYERAPTENVMIAPPSLPDIRMPADGSDFADNSSTALTLLETARKAFSEQNYFDAHYYAYWACKIGGPNNANSAEMQRIAVDAWNILSKWSGFETDEAARIFGLKRDGYAALMDNDALAAYYIYLDLYKMNDFDPDIVRYYELATEALLNEYFFIDETLNLAYFEKVRNVEFSLESTDGGRDEIHIDGITTVENTADYLKYLRNYSCASYDSEGVLLYSFTVPYVKLIGEPVSSFGVDNAHEFGIEDSDDFVPRLLLTSVDRANKGIISAPVYEEGSLPLPETAVTVIPMTLSDFELICSATMGAKYMNLASLFSFLPKAEQYGFSSVVYGASLIQRVCSPFLFFAIFIFFAIQAWNFRLCESVLFKFFWIFIFPVFTSLTQLIGEFMDYGISLVYFSLAKISGYTQIVVSVLLFLVIIIILSIRFLSLHIEPVELDTEQR